MNKKPTSDEIFNFPCDYPIKAFGKKCEQFETVVCDIITKHCGEIHPNNINTKESSKGGYVAITTRIVATSREQIDKINKELQDHNLVEYVL